MFEFPSLLWFLPLVGVPILIHLINVLRHKRIRWAPMEFLLLSQKRNRTWVMLKQFLLLLLRMLAIAAVVLMLAQPRTQNSLGALLGGTKTHHIVLLDDSFSMSDRWQGASAFEQGVKVVGRLGNQLSRQGGRQEFTLLLNSQAAHRGNGMKATLTREPVSSDFRDAIADRLQSLHVSQMAEGPLEGLSAIGQMVREGTDTATYVYIVGDFRAKEWSASGDLRRALLDLNEAGARLQLINCVDVERPNLAIASLKPGMGIRAASVPLSIEVAVTNFGLQAARDVPVQLTEDERPRPAVTIPAIPPGQTATATFEVRYPAPGQHSLAATLPADAVETDNSRFAVLDFPEAVPVLVVDGEAQAEGGHGEAYFVTLPFASNNVTPTGVAPKIVTPAFLRDKPLDPFAMIYMLNVDRLDQPAIDALEEYVKKGGGVAFFMSDRTRADFFNTRLYRDGKGLFPIPLVAPTELLVDRTETANDLTADANHPVFSLFAGQPNVDIDKVIIHKYFAAEKRWTPPTGSSAHVVAHLRNGAPLVVEQKFGAGRVLAFLTTAAPTWNNLANTPRHIAAMLQTVNYLASSRQTDPSRLVGASLSVEFERVKYDPDVKFVKPPRERPETLPVSAVPSGDHMLATLPGDANISGVYEAQLTRRDKSTETLKYAYNVSPEEGNLKIVDGPGLETRLGGVKYRFVPASDAFFDAQEFDRANMGRMVMYLLIAILVGEQLLSYSASYHPSAKELAR